LCRGPVFGTFLNFSRTRLPRMPPSGLESDDPRRFFHSWQLVPTCFTLMTSLHCSASRLFCFFRGFFFCRLGPCERWGFVDGFDFLAFLPFWFPKSWSQGAFPSVPSSGADDFFVPFLYHPECSTPQDMAIFFFPFTFFTWGTAAPFWATHHYVMDCFDFYCTPRP